MLKKVIYNSGVQLVGKIIQILGSVIAISLLTRNLGPQGYGQYTLLMTFVTFLVTTGNWGTQIIGVRQLSISRSKSSLFSSILLLRLFLALVTVSLGAIFIVLSPLFQGIKLLALTSLILVISLIIETSFNIIFQSLLKMDRRTVINMVGSFIFVLLTFVFLKINLKLLAPLLSWIITRIITVSTSFYLSQKTLPWDWNPQKRIIKQIFKQSLPLGTLLILSTAYDQAIDSFVIQKYLGESQVGFYGLAYKIYRNLVLPAYFLNNTLFPLLSKNEKLRKTLLLGLKLTLLGALVLSPLTYFSSPWVIDNLGGPQFAPSTKTLQILSFSLIFAYLNHLTGFCLVAINKQLQSLRVGILAVVFNLIANLYFVPRLGIQAAAVITLATEGITTLLSSMFLAKSLKKHA